MKYQHRIQLAIRRSLRERALGGKHYDRARAALETARSLGLQPGQPVEIEITDPETGKIEKKRFILVDNSEEMKARGVAYRPASIPCFEIKPMPKHPRKEVAAAAPAASVQAVNTDGETGAWSAPATEEAA